MSAGDGERPSDRLERALQVFVDHARSGACDAERLLREHGELRDLLEPMVAAGAADDDGAPEEQVLGDFRLVRELGRGGMGIVYEAWQRSVDRPVALKLLSPALVPSVGAVARFRREAAAIGKLRHPGIVEVHGFGSADDRHWFAMGLVDGEPLTRCTDRFRDPQRAVALVVQLLDALQHAHANGLVHRDVKPGNVLVRRDGSAVLTDFGLAHDERMPSVTVEGTFLGTLDYASPEQLQGGHVDARTDVWSTGVVLFELLAGERPFVRSSATATLKAILTEDAPPLRRLCPGVGTDLAAIVDRALQPDAGRRYASAAAMLADLRAWQSGGVVSARAQGPVERVARWVRREPWRAALAAAVAIGAPLLAGLGGYLWANAPRIAAATAAEASSRREAALTAAWLAYADGTPEPGLDALRALPAVAGGGDVLDSIEPAVAAALLHAQAGRADVAARQLEPVAAHPAAGHVITMLREPTGDASAAGAAASAVPASAIESFVLGAVAFEQAKSPERARDRFAAAARHFATAVAMAAEPRAAFLHWWMLAAARAGDASACDAAFTAYCLHFPDSAGLVSCTAMCASTVPIDRALRLLERVDIGRDSRLHLALAMLHSRAGRTADSVREYRAGVAAQPDNARAWLQLAEVLAEREEFAESAAAALEATALAPENVSAWLRLGASRFRVDDSAGAHAAFARAAELAPQQWRPRFNVALVHEDAGEHERALEHFLAASQLAPSQPEPIAHAATMWRRLKLPHDELLASVRALQLEQREWERWTAVAVLLTRVGWHEQAIVHAARATELGPERATAWSRLAEALLAAPQVDAPRALAAARRGDELARGQDARSAWTLARAEAASGDTAAATQRLQALLAQRDRLTAAVREGAAADLERLQRAR